jgi:threonine/homoserine/homoserine lactone efflux protein
MDTFTSFLAVATLAVVVPGPDTFVVLRTSLAEGARAGTWAAAGSATGNLVWGAASVLGVAALLHTSATAFSALKLLGAAYLVVLGVQALRAAVRGDALAPEGDTERPQPSSAAAFRRGVASDLLNVKSACSGPRSCRSSSRPTAARCSRPRWCSRWARWSSHG